MKKILFLLIAVSGPALADIAVTQGSGKTVATITSASREIQQVSCSVDGTSNTVVNQPVGVTTVTVSANLPMNLVSIASAPVSTGATGIMKVALTDSAGGTINSNSTALNINAAQWGGNASLTGGSNGSVGVGGLAATGAAPVGNPNYVGGLVSSITWPTQQTDAKVMPILVDNLGRLMDGNGCANGVILTTSSVNMAYSNTELVLVSSAAANNYTDLCGCIFNNQTATNDYFTIRQDTTPWIAANNYAQVQIGSPANDIPTGVRPDCSHPFFTGRVGGQITIQASTAQTSIAGYCMYCQHP